jgi:CMP-N-acetylneuraminic acid synthetase
MFNKKKVIVIIPVRGGSKGIPRKNLYKIGNDTLLERTIKLAKKCTRVDRVIVSTDDDEMYAISKKYCVNTKEKRPSYLASDTASTIDVIIHTLEESSIDDAYVLLLQVTSPLRTLDDLNNLLDSFSNHRDANAIISMCEHDDPHPAKIQKIENGFVQSYMGVESMVARQMLPKVYRLNGAFYLTHLDIIKSKRSFFTNKTMPYIMPPERSINLDTMNDLYLLESLIDKGIVNVENEK